MEGKIIVKLIAEELKNLHIAAKTLFIPTIPRTPLPRPRRFRLLPNLWWPALSQSENLYYQMMYLEWEQPDQTRRFMELKWLENLAITLAEMCGYQPRKALRLLRNIQSATAWCEHRLEGQRRAAQEILRQQRSSVEALEAEAVIKALAKKTS